MADKTFGVKVSEELYDKVRLMIESSGTSSKEWFEKAIALTEVQNLKTGAPNYKQDLSELDGHTTRIYKLIANMIERSENLKDEAVHDLEEKLESRESTISSLQAEIRNREKQLQTLEETAQQSITEQEEMAGQLEDQRSLNENHQALIEEYKEKIDTLSTLVNDYKAYAQENEQLKTDFAEEKESFRTDYEAQEKTWLKAQEKLNNTIKSEQEEKQALASQLSEKQRQNEQVKQDIASLKVGHEEQLNQLEKEKELEKERAILTAEREFQQQLQKAHEDFNERIATFYERFELEKPPIKQQDSNDQ